MLGKVLLVVLLACSALQGIVANNYGDVTLAGQYAPYMDKHGLALWAAAHGYTLRSSGPMAKLSRVVSA